MKNTRSIDEILGFLLSGFMTASLSPPRVFGTKFCVNLCVRCLIGNNAKYCPCKSSVSSRALHNYAFNFSISADVWLCTFSTRIYAVKGIRKLWDSEEEQMFEKLGSFCLNQQKMSSSTMPLADMNIYLYYQVTSHFKEINHFGILPAGGDRITNRTHYTRWLFHFRRVSLVQ